MVEDTAVTSVLFDVFGVPYPQGSKRAFVANGKAIMTEASGTGHAAWRNAVAEAAHARAATCGTFTGPLHLDVSFLFPMPKSRSRAKRDAGACPKTTAPDLDKLLRTVGDALKAGGLIADDALIVSVCASKTEVIGWTGATITVTKT